jgi:hypothetical protein
MVWWNRSRFPSPEDGGASDAVDTEAEGAHAEVAVVAPAHLLHVLERALHVCLQLRVHLLLVPHEPLDVLNNQSKAWPVTHTHQWICISMKDAQERCGRQFRGQYLNAKITGYGTDLNPLEVAHRDTTRVCEYVGQDYNTFL